VLCSLFSVPLVQERLGSEDDEGGAPGPMLDSGDEDDGYVSPEFDLPPGSDEEETAPPPAKRAKSQWSRTEGNHDDDTYNGRVAAKTSKSGELEDEEALALRLLRRA
jgi:ATP-dependent RNA helicase DDX10/DBP4